MVKSMLYAFVICCLFAAHVLGYSGGSGTPEDPYRIATAQDLIDLGQTTEDYDKSFILTADIDLSGMVFDWAVIAPDMNDVVIGFQGVWFSGHFDGQGHAIRHLHIQGRNYLGLFGKLGSFAVIASLGLEDVDISGNQAVGGLVGENEGSISSCYSIGIVNGNRNVGGLVANNIHGRISSCYNASTVRGTYPVGGLVGVDQQGSIWSSYNAGTVSGDSSVGGLVGYSNSSSSIWLSYNTSTVSGNSYYVGGLVGNNSGCIWSSYNTGMISGTVCVGGLVGLNKHTSVSTSYSTGTIIGKSYIGGLVGQNDGSISSSYSTGMVSGGSDIGGLVGDNIHGGTGNYSGHISSSFWDVQTSGLSHSDGGTGLRTSQMQEINTFQDAGWDSTNETENGTCDYWQLQDGNYPSLAVFSNSVPAEPNGAGTREDPYLITDANELGTVWYNPLAHYRLTSDIDLSDMTWGMAVVPWFKGSLDGNQFCIRSLHIKGAGYLGLFGASSSGSEVTNLGLENVLIEGTGQYIGGLVGNNDSNISLSYSKGSIDGHWDVGGLVGINHDDVVSSFSHGQVSGDQDVGGLVGDNRSIISSCYSTDRVSGNKSVGGLVGGNRNAYAQISTTYSTGTVSGNLDVGGLVGLDENSTTSSSFWDTDTSGLTESAGGTGLSTTDMQDINTFLNAGWDFTDEADNGTEDIWFIPDQDYPHLAWEEEGG